MGEHGRLLAKIKQKKSERDRLSRQLAAGLSGGARQGALLIDEMAVIDGQIHALFRALLTRPQQLRKTRKIVQTMYLSLQAAGRISPSVDADGAAQDASDPADSESESESKAPPRGTGGVSAQRPIEQPAGSRSLRVLYHQLVTVLHPDRVKDEQEKAERTEVMKALTQAYRSGDLAQLLNLERVWILSKGLGETAEKSGAQPDLAAHCAQLEATNRALALQLDGIKKSLRELRRTPEAQFLSDLKHLAHGSKQEPVEVWLRRLRAEQRRLTALREFVRSYHDGWIDLEEFARGPQSAADSASGAAE